MNRKQQGDIGVASAIYHYTSQGHTVCVPLTDNARYDLVVDMGGLRRVQVKTTGYQERGFYRVQLSTQGGNRSWDGTKKFIDADECDIVYVYCLDGTVYEFPVNVAAGRASITLSQKYEEYKK